MVKLVVLSAGMSGRTHELNADRTTVGRLEDNMLQLPESSVSSHHCEILLKGDTVTVKDLNSTNGTFINGEKISESVLKPGQTLRLGQVELRIDTGAGAPAPAPSSASAPAPAPAPAPAASSQKKTTDQTLLMQRGVKLDELEGARPSTVGTGFTRKDNKASKIVWYVAGAFGLIIAALLLYVFAIAK